MRGVVERRPKPFADLTEIHQAIVHGFLHIPQITTNRCHWQIGFFVLFIYYFHGKLLSYPPPLPPLSSTNRYKYKYKYK